MIYCFYENNGKGMIFENQSMQTVHANCVSDFFEFPGVSTPNKIKISKKKTVMHVALQVFNMKTHLLNVP